MGGVAASTCDRRRGWRALWPAKSGSVSVAWRAARKRRVSGLGSIARVAVAAGVREFGSANQRAANRKSNVPAKRGVPPPESPFIDRKKAAQVEERLSSSLGTANVLA